MKDFYYRYMLAMMAAGDTDRQACRKHWAGCLMDDIRTGRDTEHSTRMLAMIAMAEEYGDQK